LSWTKQLSILDSLHKVENADRNISFLHNV
jgi:hypothetical protein